MPGPAGKPTRLTADEAALREQLNRPPEWSPATAHLFHPASRAFGEELPRVPHAPAFRPEPLVVGQHLQRPVESLLRLAPELRGQVSSVVAGPTRGSMSAMVEDGLRPDQFEGTTLGGITDRRASHRGQVGINPSSRGAELDDTLGHEFRHVVGGDEDEAQAAGALTSKARAAWSPISAFMQRFSRPK